MDVRCIVLDFGPNDRKWMLILVEGYRTGDHLEHDDAEAVNVGFVSWRTFSQKFGGQIAGRSFKLTLCRKISFDGAQDSRDSEVAQCNSTECIRLKENIAGFDISMNLFLASARNRRRRLLEKRSRQCPFPVIDRAF